MKQSTRLLALVALLALVTVPGFAQGTSAALTGTVTSDGKPLPGATITVTSPSLQGTRTAVTGSNGDYNFPALPPGAYTVTIELEGLQKMTVKKQLSTWQEDVTGDRNSLLKVRGDLNGTLLTLPEQATIDRHRHRVDAALSALGTAQKGIGLFNKQLAFLDPLIDALAGNSVQRGVDAACDTEEWTGLRSEDR